MFVPLFIGGSLGSVDALKQLLKNLPEGYRSPIVFVYHQRVKSDQVVKDLSEFTSYKVQIAENGMDLKPSNLYLSVADKHLIFSPSGKLLLSNKEDINYTRPSIDLFFKTAVHVFKNKAFYVLLSGSNADGVEGLKSAEKVKGRIFIQDPTEAFSPRMPKLATESITKYESLSVFSPDNLFV